MARVAATQIENNFVKGLVTEATGLNYPENSCTDTDNCVFELTGEVTRRLGFDTENSSSPLTANRADVASVSYVWKDAGGDGNITLIVTQIGSTLHFFNTTSNPSISLGVSSFTVDLTSFSPTGGADPGLNECQFSDGNGYLYVVHPSLEVFYVAYDPSTGNISTSQVDLKVRDFIGEKTDTNYEDSVRPSSLSNAHHYNLLNQGWTSDLAGNQWFTWVTVTSSTTNGSPQLSLLNTADGSKLAIGMVATAGNNGIQGKHISSVSVSEPTGTTNTSAATMDGNATANGTNIVSSWQMAGYPSNSDVWWYFQNGYGHFASSSIAAMGQITSPAPKGHYISSAYKIDRNALSGLTGLTTDSCGTARPSVTAFHAGRVWFGGIRANNYNANIYFSQTLDDVSKSGKCYQEQDPTDQTLFDLLPTDGGMIAINGCGTVYKLFSTGTSLIVFASNGIWEITGNQGIGFVANDFSVNKLSNVPTISHRSFVDVGGIPMWWNIDGIYTLQHSQVGTEVKSLTTSTIQTFYAGIPNNNKMYARGAYNPLTNIVQWLFRAGEADSLEDNYKYNRALNINTATGAFYPWSVDNTGWALNAVLLLQSSVGDVQTLQVVDEDGTTLVKDNGSQVIVFSTQGNLSDAAFFYAVSRPDGSGSFENTFGKCESDTYTDWAKDDEKDYKSYFVSGYQIRGDANRNFQDNYVSVYSRSDIDTKYNFQGLFNWARNSDSGAYGTRSQNVVSYDPRFAYRPKRLLLRGTGKAVQFKVGSVSGYPFDIIGWSVWITGNQGV